MRLHDNVNDLKGQSARPEIPGRPLHREGRSQTAVGFQEEMRRSRKTASAELLFEAVWVSGM